MDISTAFVKQWDDTIRLQAQQRESRLEATVTDRGAITGESFTANRLAPLDKTPEKTVRHADTIWSTPDHSTRLVNMRDFYEALPLDRNDIPKLIANPMSGPYMQSLLSAWNRRKDDIIYRALIDAALTKEGTTVALPSTQIILNGATGFTKAKLIAARKQFRKKEADGHNGEELYIVYTADMLEDILSDTTLTSADFLAGKMLQEGDLSKKWMGFNWVPFEGVDIDVVSAGVASTVAYAKSALHKGTGYVEGNVSTRNDKQNTKQADMAGSFGAGRVEEEKVIRIDFVY